jgi:hypothetical protein
LHRRAWISSANGDQEQSTATGIWAASLTQWMASLSTVRRVEQAISFTESGKPATAKEAEGGAIVSGARCAHTTEGAQQSRPDASWLQRPSRLPLGRNDQSGGSVAQALVAHACSSRLV